MLSQSERARLLTGLMNKPRLNGADGPIISESSALKIIDHIAPGIPPEKLWEILYMVVECDRRTVSEIEFFACHGYWPEADRKSAANAARSPYEQF
jgi:hypothetical protein